MSTTTDILFNSPALHSLKRDQLVKLCKVHSIKASGKNVELIEKLKKHAETLPRDDPLHFAARSERHAGEILQLPDDGNAEENDDDSQVAEEDSQPANASWGFQLPRPSEQWEVVMESINEEEERSSQGTLNSLRTIGSNNGASGEFGTGLSKSSSVSSSIKALASSLGWKRDDASKSALASSSSLPRAPSSKLKSQLSLRADNDLLQHSVPYSLLPEPVAPPQTDHLTFDPTFQGVNGIHALEKTSPLPGHSLRPGVPAPVNARLSLGLNAPSTPTRQSQPTTTIRLISNPFSNGSDSPYGRTPQLKPFKTNFDLVLGSPGATYRGFDNVSVWPNNGDDNKSIYPPLPLDTLSATTEDENMEDHSAPGAFPDSSKHPFTITSPSAPTTQLTVPEPFVFGSPLPQHNVSDTQFKIAASSVLTEMNKRLEADGVAGIGVDLIKKLQPGAHTEIVTRLRTNGAEESPRSGGLKEKFDKIHAQEFSKMEGIDSLVRRKAQAGRTGVNGADAPKKGRKSSMGAGRDRFGRRIGGDRASGRISAASVIGNKKKPRVIPGSFNDEDSADEGDEAKEEHSTADLPAVIENKSSDDTEMESETRKIDEEERQRKEKEAIRRKLKLNRARRRSSVGRGRVSVGKGGVLVKQQPPPKPSRFGFFSTAKSLVQKVWNGGKSAQPTASTSGIPKPLVKPSIVAPRQQPALLPKKAPPSRPSVAPRPVGRVSSLRADKDKTTGTVASTTTSVRARSPLPSFGPSSSSTRSSLAKAGRGSSVTGTGTSTVSSVGTRSSTSTSSSTKTGSTGDVGSMGLKKPSASAGMGSRSTVASASSSSSRLSSRLSSSRLLAPTVSSLAKATRPSGSNLKTVAETFQTRQTPAQSSVALGMITNNPTAVSGPWSPRREGIFSQPLTVPSGIPSPVKSRPIEASTAPEQADLSVTAGTTKLAAARQRSISGRKPRISRSKVIAKLASQRAAGGGGLSGPTAAGGMPTPSSRGGGRTRSSLGVKAQQRSSLGAKVGGARKAADEGVLLSAKKRARQSEYARRRSRVAPVDFGADVAPSTNDMEVDAA